MQVLVTAALLGARILEKHFTHDKRLPGNDHYHAMDRDDLRRFRERMRDIRTLIGSSDLRAAASEAPARRNARRSLVAVRDICRGAVIGAEDVTFKRPAHGISPRCSDEVVGMRARVDIAADSVLQWSMLE
jgi:N-acetylneuraminate synthase